MVTYRRYLSSDDIASPNSYLSAPISTRRHRTSGLICIECLVYFWICPTLFVIPFVSLHHAQPFHPCFTFSFRLCAPLVYSFSDSSSDVSRFIRSHGPTCLCSSLIHSFTRPTPIPICSQIVLTFLIPFVFLSLPFWADVPQYGRTVG